MATHGHMSAASVNQLKVMSAAPTELRLLQVERAEGMGFNISNHTARGKKTTLTVFEQKLTTEFLNWGQYMSVHIMGVVAEAINHIIMVWVAHPQDKTALIVHYLHSMQGGGLAIHAPMHAKGVVHLRFLNSANELDSDVFKWGAGNAGHIELLCEPVNGWPKRKADTFTPRRGPQNQKRGAKGSPDVCFEAWAKILPRWHISGHLKILRTISGNTVPTYQVLLDGFGLKHT